MGSNARRGPLAVTIRREGTVIGSRVIGKDRISIGRAPCCDIVLASDRVARLHAVLERSLDGAGYALVNVCWAGETRLNSVPIERAELDDGDAIALGDFELTIAWKEAGGPKLHPHDLVDDLVLVPQPTKVLWSATSEEMDQLPTTGEVNIPPLLYALKDVDYDDDGEPIILLTKAKTKTKRALASAR
jgi:hypothetical protein